MVLTEAVENTFTCMKAAYDSGINFFDCAEGYAGKEILLKIDSRIQIRGLM